jgi:hypothetical protein
MGDAHVAFANSSEASTLNRWWLRVLAWFVAALVAGQGAWAQSVESVLSPGPLIRGHAKVEGDCKNCHVRFDRAAQDGLCIACHKDTGRDLREKTGFHGRSKPQACRTCHTDHRGADARIAEFDRKSFDHRITDYALHGKHETVDCGKCHTEGRKYRDAPSDCLACHRKDDVHKGSLGAKCADCHVEQSWKEARFDHSTARFPLTGKHADAKCATCHKTTNYKEAPMTCIGCHRKDDKHKARYGEKCETCHGTSNWTGITFKHDTDTTFALRGKHRETRCDSCHTGVLYRDKAGTACIDCHRKDDKHTGTLGTDCVACHTERNWRDTPKFDHDRSKFPLRGGHVKVECTSCHKSTRYKEAPSDCVACHRKDDKHEGTLGTGCADCHTDRDWKATRFDHARTRFALRLGHAVPPLKCSNCHRDQKSYRPTAVDCFSCHRKDDKHEGQLGTRCEICHSDRSWKGAPFDHAKARFALTGAHVRVECSSCHKTARYRDAARDCIGCHLKDDKHKSRFGEKCESCHNARDWKLWFFDHKRQADYPIEGAHAKVRCEACHIKPAAKGQLAAPLDRVCRSCHRRDDVHDGAFGPRCDQCHSVTQWKQVTNRTGGSARPASDPPSSPASGVVR